MSEPNEPDIEDVAPVPEEWSADDLPGEAIHPAVAGEDGDT